MIDLLHRFVEFPFYQRALIAGVAIAAACSVLSVFVVQKRMAFIGQGISHAAFGGVGLALLLELYAPAFGAPFMRDATIALFCVATAVLIGKLERGRRFSEDSAIGICLVVAMASGVLLLDVRTEMFKRLSAKGALPPGASGYTPSYHDILFGNILSVSTEDVIGAIVVAAVVLAFVFLLFKELVFYGFDEEASEAFGVRVGLARYGLLVVLGVVVVVAMRLLGVILCSSLLILPGAVANQWSRKIEWVLAIAVASGVLGVMIGLALSMELRVLSTGPLVVEVLAAALLASLGLGRLTKSKNVRA